MRLGAVAGGGRPPWPYGRPAVVATSVGGWRQRRQHRRLVRRSAAPVRGHLQRLIGQRRRNTGAAQSRRRLAWARRACRRDAALHWPFSRPHHGVGRRVPRPYLDTSRQPRPPHAVEFSRGGWRRGRNCRWPSGRSDCRFASAPIWLWGFCSAGKPPCKAGTSPGRPCGARDHPAVAAGVAASAVRQPHPDVQPASHAPLVPLRFTWPPAPVRVMVAVAL